MKANTSIAAAMGAVFLLGGCVATPPPPPAPPPPVVRPAPPPPAPPAAVGWRDAALTPGEWRWSGAQAAYGSAGAMPALVLRCERARGIVQILRSGAAPASSVPGLMSVSTTTARFTVAVQPAAATTILPGGALAELPARSPILDAMAFSRGRFALDIGGMPTLIAPSWPEVSRVIEECR